MFKIVLHALYRDLSQYKCQPCLYRHRAPLLTYSDPTTLGSGEKIKDYVEEDLAVLGWERSWIESVLPSMSSHVAEEIHLPRRNTHRGCTLAGITDACSQVPQSIKSVQRGHGPNSVGPSHLPPSFHSISTLVWPIPYVQAKLVNLRTCFVPWSRFDHSA